MNFTGIAGDKKHRIIKINTTFKAEVPAQMQINKRTVSGKIIIDKTGFKFIPNKKCANYKVWENPQAYPTTH